jgi:Family of unknown function (DUF6152)
MNRRFVRILVSLLIITALPVYAHHSGAIYDREKDVTIEGTVKEWQWTNPHVFLQVLVTDSKGVSTEWSIEGGALTNMKRAGWERSGFNFGDKVTVIFHPLKSGAPGGTVIEATNKTTGKAYQYHG